MSNYKDIKYVSTDLVNDTTPQLGGDLDGNGNTINLSGNVTHVNLPRGTTAQQVTPAANNEGAIRYNTDNNFVYYSDGSTWKKISPVPVVFSSISGSIIEGTSSTLTLSGTGFGTSITVNFTQSADAIDEDVAVTPASDTSATVTVPAAVYNNVTAGNVVTVTITNDDNNVATQNTTAASLPTGGTISTYGSYRVHTFTSSGNFVVSSGFTPQIDTLLVAGGGAGGNWHAGGGGAGGMFTYQSTPSAGTYSVTIGAGGAGGSSSVGSNGGNTSVFSQTASGGGRGGSYDYTSPASGGSGAGGNGSNIASMYTGASGIAGQGNAGGNGNGLHGGGGGGGKGATGQSAPSSSQAGNGGIGGTNDYQTGTNQYYAGGGGGGVWSGTRGTGGNGGGGDGSYSQNGGAPSAGAANTGGGGGGSGAQGNVANWSSQTTGGSGIVIIRYQV